MCVCVCVRTRSLTLSFSQVGDIAQKEIEEAKERMAKFAPGGPGTEQV